MVANALQNGSEHLGLAGVQTEVEEHARRLGILKGAAVAVEPRGKDHAPRSRRDGLNGVGHVIIQALVHRLLALGHIGLLQINADLVQHQVLLDPLEALARGLHLGKIVVFPRLRAYDAGDHGHNIHCLAANDCADPAGGAGIDVGLSHLRAACAHADERGVSSAAVHGAALRQTQILSGSGCERSGHIRTLDDAGQVVKLHAVHPAKHAAPAALVGAAVVEEGGIGRVAGHHELTRAASDEILLHIQPFMYLGVHLRLVLLDPLVFPQGILDAGGGGSGAAETAQQHECIHAGNGKAVGLAGGKFSAAPLIHVAHGAAQGAARLVHQHQTLHLGAERDAGDALGVGAGLFQKASGAFGHGRPPLVGVLFRAAAGQDVEAVALVLSGQQPQGVAHLKKAGLDAGGANVICDHIHGDLLLFLMHF